jgi:ATP-dependent exoDNAse (exonuclease V) beta subunit
VELANHLFPAVFPTPCLLFDDVEFAPSTTTRTEREEVERVQIAVFPSEKDSPELDARRREARWVAARVARLYENHGHESIAVLLPARTHLPIFHEEIISVGLPIRLVEGRPFLDCSEVRHLLNLFTALLRPFDDLAWAAAVRAPWFRISLQELEELASSPEVLWPDKLASRPSTAAFWEPCARARERLGREPYGETLLTLWQELSGPLVTAGLWGAQAVTNARALLTILDDLAPALGEEALERVNRKLSTSYAPPDPRAASSPISMMTIHQAKGLEFDHVVVVVLDRTHRQKGQSSPPVFLSEKLPDGSSLTTVGRDRRDGGASLTWGVLQRLEGQRALAESRRLFYVAATRARESLALTGVYSKKKDPAEEFQDESPISWTVRSLREGALATCSVELLDDPEDAVEPLQTQMPSEIPAPAGFDPAPLPYLVESPSRLAEDTGLAIRSGEEEVDVRARARGLIIHRLLETLARGQKLPGEKAVAAALASEGLSPTESTREAKDALLEAHAAWDLPAFQDLRQGAQLFPEWSVEEAYERDGESIVRIGRLDLLLKTSDQWIVLDYKTSQLPPDISPLVERFRPQLRSYIEMIAPTDGSPEHKTAAYLLLTAGPLLVEVV